MEVHIRLFRGPVPLLLLCRFARYLRSCVRGVGCWVVRLVLGVGWDGDGVGAWALAGAWVAGIRRMGG